MTKCTSVIPGVLLFVFFALVASGKGGSGGVVHVNGYTRKDGTYVAPYVRTAPNSTKADNWSTQGNVNPYTGEEGTKRTDNSHTSSATSIQTPTSPALPSSAPIASTPPAPKGTNYFSKYEILTREQLLAKVTELEAKNEQLERRLASQLTAQAAH